jgi:hypothetical protein
VQSQALGPEGHQLAEFEPRQLAQLLDPIDIGEDIFRAE